jgi:hypothetical protein
VSSTKPINPVMKFIDMCEGSEVSDLFATWTGIAGVSMCLGRRVWLDMGTFKVFPNMFVILVAGSGAQHKSTVLNLLEPCLPTTDPPINFISDSLTPQALFQAAMKAERTDPLTGQITTELVLVASELASFLNEDSWKRGIAPYLTRMFDCQAKMEYGTLARDKETVRNVTLTMLAASTVDFIRAALPHSAIGSGFTSRCLFIYTDKYPKAVARPQKISNLQQDPIRHSLTLVRQMAGEAEFTPEAFELHEREYIYRHEHSPFRTNPLLSGYLGRWQYHMLALAMCLSASDNPLQKKLILLPKHIEAATAILDQSELNMPRVMRLVASSDKGAHAEMLKTIIDQCPTEDVIDEKTGKKVGERPVGIHRAELIDNVLHMMGMRDFEEGISMLVSAGRVRRTGEHGTIYVPIRR